MENKRNARKRKRLATNRYLKLEQSGPLILLLTREANQKIAKEKQQHQQHKDQTEVTRK